MRLTLGEIVEGQRAEVPCGSPDTSFEGASVDSRAVPPDALFVGLPGENHDGGRFAADALRAGAAAALVGRDVWPSIEGECRANGWSVAVAHDPLVVLQAAGRHVLGHLGATVVAITGSVGKTTTKDILVAMLEGAGVTAQGTPGNQNTEVGVPLAALGLRDDVDVAVVEMGMRGEGQIAELVRLAPPDVACITSVAPVHLELLRTIENIAAAKAEILTGLRPGGTAVVPEGEALLDRYVEALPHGVEVLRFGDDVPDGVDIALDKAWQRRNAAAAYACCVALDRLPNPGRPVEVALSAMRGQERPLPGGGTLIVDCYNANPVAMEAALRDLARRDGRKVAVLGDMRELGPDERRFHREVGARARELGVDLLVAVGDLARDYADGADGVPAVMFPDARPAADGVASHLEPGDVVLVKASRGMALEHVADAPVPAHAPR